MSRRIAGAAEALAGHVAVMVAIALRSAPRMLRSALRAAPGVAGAAAVAVGVGQVAGHVWGRGLTWWVALAVAGAFALRVGAEVNARPPAPRRDDAG